MNTPFRKTQTQRRQTDKQTGDGPDQASAGELPGPPTARLDAWRAESPPKAASTTSTYTYKRQGHGTPAPGRRRRGDDSCDRRRGRSREQHPTRRGSRAIAPRSSTCFPKTDRALTNAATTTWFVRPGGSKFQTDVYPPKFQTEVFEQTTRSAQRAEKLVLKTNDAERTGLQVPPSARCPAASEKRASAARAAADRRLRRRQLELNSHLRQRRAAAAAAARSLTSGAAPRCPRPPTRASTGINDRVPPRADTSPSWWLRAPRTERPQP